MIQLLLNGANGKMSRQIDDLARFDSRFEVVCRLHRFDNIKLNNLKKIKPKVILDFSSDIGAHRAAMLAGDANVAVLIGTTGLQPETMRAIKQASRSVAVLIAPNTSLGAALLNHALAVIAGRLGQGFEIDVIEAHHAAKQDAPSGTAKRLAETICHAGGEMSESRIQALRTGKIVGRHLVRFHSPGETIQLSHAVESRQVFAQGALEAAAWLHNQPPGLYSMHDVLNLPDIEGVKVIPITG